MKNYLSNLDTKLLRVIQEVGREADRRGLSAYVVGGIVRDIILKKKNLDLDIVVEGDALALAKALAKKWKTRLTLYKQFGTACLEMRGGLRVDLTTARKERYAHPGALPTVRAGGLKEDLFRRDFTVNTMAIAINPDGFGQLVDKFGGLADLSSKKVRILHDQSFTDDPTRILRAVRFEQRFHFHMERRTLSLMKTALHKKAVASVKPPRYFSEFKKILCEADPLKCLKRLHHLGGLRFLDPKLDVRFQEMSLMHQRIQKIKQKLLYKQNNCWWLIYFMGLIARANDRTIEGILAKFHFTRDERTSILQSQKTKEIIKRLSVPSLLSSQVYQILRPLSMEAVFYLRVRTSRTVVCRRIDCFLAKDSNVKLQINGKDLKQMGVASGCEMGRVLEDVLCLKIDKRVRTKREELNAALLSLGRY